MDVKKHFWVDYLACLIFGAVIVPLWYFLNNYSCFKVMCVFTSVAVFAGIHVVCFVGLQFFLKEKEKRVLFLYCAWSVFWFSFPIARQFVPFAWLCFRFKFHCMTLLTMVVLSAIFVLLKKMKSVFRVIRIIGKVVYTLFVLMLFQICKTTLNYQRGGDHVDVKSDYPNIYQILLDAHPGQDVFERFGGDLKPFYCELKKLGFVTYPKSRSVYLETVHSVGAMWHMDAGLHDSILDSVAFKTFEKMYNIRMFYSSEMITHVYRIRNSLHYVGFLECFYSFIRETFVRAAFERCFAGAMREVFKKSHRSVLLELENGKNASGSLGNFFYGHILSPHPPIVYSDTLCFSGLSKRDLDSAGIHMPCWNRIICEEVYAIDDMVLATIKTILEQYKNEPAKPIIILHSDHGITRNTGMVNGPVEDTVWGNLFAIYMPDEWKKDAKDLKFINLYRFIFNHLFGTNYEYLPDVQKYSDGRVFEEKTLPSSSHKR